jgi:nucleolar protein 56
MEMAITPGKILIFDGKEKKGEEIFKPEALGDAVSRVKKNYDSPDLKSYKLQILTKESNLSEKDYLKKLADLSFRLTESRIAEAVGRDELIIQAVNSIDDLNREINFLTSRIREWYGLSDHESSKFIEDHEKLVDMVIEDVKVSQFGLKLRDNDVKMIKYFAKFIKENYQLKENLEKYVDSIMQDIAPNVRALVGPILGAKLLARAGGLYKLAMMPGSTIQVLGAEKALFRHLIKGTPSPKHGLLYQHPMISSKSRALRGRIARSLSAKISIAARMDYYKRGLDPSLVKKFEKRLKELKK